MVASEVFGDKVNITARKDDINIIGSDVSGSLNTDLSAAKNVNIASFEEIYTNRSNNKSSGWNAGVAVEFGQGMSFGFTGGANYGKGHANADSTTHRNSHVGSNTGKTTITAGETVNIKGGQISGKGVDLTAKDLNIESMQDTMTYDSRQENVSGSITVGYGVSGSASYSKSKVNADYASVNEQSGIFAGDDGYRINVKNHTDLKGGLITSTDKAEKDGKNAFSTGTLTFEDLANKSEYSGSGFGIGVQGTVSGSGSNPNVMNVADKNSLSHNGIGYASDSDSQSSVTKSGINTANIVITDKNKQKEITGKSAEETLNAVKTDITTDNYAANQGSLKNNFDAAKVQGEIDLGVEVMQDFSRNVQDLNRRKNIELDELKEELKAGKKTQEEYDSEVKKIETQKVVINMIAGGLMSPSDSALGIATSTVSPAVSFQVGQHFKKEGKEGSFEHIATHAVIGALTSAANGGNALSGAVSAGGAEYIAQVTAQTLFQKDAKDLTADEKQTVSSIAQLVGVISGSVTGDSSANAYIGNLNAQTAVNNNLLSPDEWKELSRLDEKARKNGTLSKPEAERAKFLLNKHGYTERLLAKEQNGETLSKGEKSDLDNAIYEAYPDREVANRIRNYKGPVAQGDYRDLKTVVNREIGYSESFQGQMTESMQPALTFGAFYYGSPYLLRYGKAATGSVAFDSGITVLLEDKPVTLYDIKHSATIGTWTGYPLSKARKAITTNAFKPIHLPNGVVSQVPNTLETKIVQAGTNVALNTKEKAIGYGVGKATSEMANGSILGDKNNSPVVFKSRSEYWNDFKNKFLKDK